MVQHGRSNRSSWAESVRILWQGCCGKGNLRRSCCSTVGRRFSNLERLFVEIGLLLSVHVDDTKLAGNKTLIRCWMFSIKKLIWENQHFCHDHENLGCPQIQCEISIDLTDNHRPEFDSRRRTKVIFFFVFASSLFMPRGGWCTSESSNGWIKILCGNQAPAEQWHRGQKRPQSSRSAILSRCQEEVQIARDFHRIFSQKRRWWR